LPIWTRSASLSALSWWRAEVADHVGGGEQAPVLRDQLEEVGGERGELGLGEDGAQRLGLVLRGDHGTAHQPAQVLAALQHGAEGGEVGLDPRQLPLLLGQLEQGCRVAARHARHHRFFSRHVERFRSEQ
jgi:hypothetical protein